MTSLLLSSRFKRRHSVPHKFHREPYQSNGMQSTLRLRRLPSYRLRAILLQMWSATGLPTGLQINATTGEITGTPTVAQSATNATITASNGVGNDDSVTISFAVVTGIAPQFGTFADPTLFINTPYSLTLTATGTPEPVITQQLGIPSRDSDRDINLDEGFWHGVFRLGNRLYFIRINSNTLVAYDFDRARQAGQDITVAYTGPILE